MTTIHGFATLASGKGLSWWARQKNKNKEQEVRKVAARLFPLFPFSTVSFSPQGISIQEHGRKDVLSGTEDLGKSLSQSFQNLRFVRSPNKFDLVEILQILLTAPKWRLPERLTGYGIVLKTGAEEECSLPVTWTELLDALAPLGYNLDSSLNLSVGLAVFGLYTGIGLGLGFPDSSPGFIFGTPVGGFVLGGVLYPLGLLGRRLLRTAEFPGGYQHFFALAAGERPLSLRQIRNMLLRIKDEAMVARLIQSFSPPLMAEVLLHHSFSSKRFHPLRAALAEKANDAKTLIVLSGYSHLGIKLAVAKNPASPAEALENIHNEWEADPPSQEAVKHPNATPRMIAITLSNLRETVPPEKRAEFLAFANGFLADHCSSDKRNLVIEETRRIDSALHAELVYYQEV